MASTVYASVSTPGPPGSQGPPGATGYSPQYIVAAGPPTAGQGQVGDMFINSTNSDLYGPKTAGGWGGVVANIRGATGATGPAGYSPLYIVAPGAPTAGQGQVGDMFINSTTSDLYGPKTSGGWGPIVANIKGLTGAQGPPGVAASPQGAWSAATTYLQGDLVTYQSALYISLQSTNLNHVPSTSPTYWQSVVTTGQTPWTQDISGAGFRLLNTGNVGIGNNLPALPDANTSNTHLVVGPTVAGTAAGEITVCGNTTAPGNVGTVNFANYNLAPADKRIALLLGATDGAVNSGYLAFYTANAGAIAERMRITSGGNVGIGTASPAALLHAAIDVAGGEICRLSGSNTANRLALGWDASNNTSVIASLLGSGGRPLLLNPIGGNVGIGTTSPLCTLHVASSATAGNPATSGTADATVAERFDAVNVGTALDFGVNGSGVAWIQNRAKSSFATNYPMALNPNGGNVGIGTASPGALLDVLAPTAEVHITSTTVGTYVRYEANNGNNILQVGVENSSGGTVATGTTPNASYIGSQFAFPLQFVTQANVKMTLASNGNLGIGSANPLKLLTVRPGTNLNLGVAAGPTVSNSVSIEALNDAATANINLEIRSLSTVFAIGNVGIATAPAVPLDVLTDSNGAGLRLRQSNVPTTNYFTWTVDNASNGAAKLIGYDSGTSALGLVQTRAGRVGIAQSAPGYALDVAGDCNISGTFRVNGTPISTGGGITGMMTQNNAGSAIGPTPYYNFAPSANITWSLVLGGSGNNTCSITAIYSASDARLKTDVKDLVGGLSLIEQLRPKEFRYNGLANLIPGQRSVSLIAQDLSAISPDLVHVWRTKLHPDDAEETNLLNYNPVEITMHLVLSVQQLEQRLRALETKAN